MHAKYPKSSLYVRVSIYCQNLNLYIRRENEIGETHPLTHLHNLYNLLFISIFACKLNPYLFDFIRMYMNL